MLRELLSAIRFKTAQAGRVASRTQRVVRYGLDLILWSRLLSSRRAAIPTDLPQRLLESKKVRFDPPILSVSSPEAGSRQWTRGFQACYASLFLNLQMPDVLSKIRYAHPAPSFEGIYLWDSAFIAQVWKHWDCAVAADVDQAVLDYQEEGRLQHVVANFTESKYTQPAVMAWSVQQLLESQPKLAKGRFVEDFYEPLKTYNAWLYRERRHENGLFFWEHPYESGIDNSPRFSTRDESRFADTRKMAAPDCSAYLVLQNESLAAMAEHLGRWDDASRFQQQADELRELTNELLWDDHDGFYYDRMQDSGEFVRQSTIAGLLPLWAGIPDDAQAVRLCETITEEAAYNTLIPLPSVAKNNPDFSKDMWRGPVWINTAYAVIQGLQRYRFFDEAGSLAYRLCEGVFQTYENEQRFFEFYDPDRCDLTELNRKKGNRFKKLTLGSKPVKEFVGWTGLVNTLVIEDLFGYRRTPQGLQIRPGFPPHLAGQSWHLQLPQYQQSLDIEIRDAETFEIRLRNTDGIRERILQRGECWELSTTNSTAVDSPLLTPVITGAE